LKNKENVNDDKFDDDDDDNDSRAEKV